MRTKEIVGAILALTLLLGIVPFALTGAPSTPFEVGGHVYLGATPVSGAAVNVTNQATGEYLTTTTDSNGAYVVALGNLPSGHSAGNTIEVTATYSGMTGNSSAPRSESLSDSPQIIDVTLEVAVTITISGPATISLDDPAQTFSAICEDANDIVISPCPTLTWHSSNTAVGGITSGGVFTALVAGTTTITASAAGVTSNTVIVTVNAESSGDQPVTGGNGSATSGDSHADVTLNNTAVSGTVNVTEIGDPINDLLSSADGNDTGLGLGPNANQLIKGAVVNVNESVRDALLADVNDTSWVHIRLNYSQSVVESLGIDESSIDIWKYNTATNSWEKVKDQPSYCISDGRSTADNYVWCNVTELSTFALVGTKTKITPSGGGSGGSGTYPPGWLGTPTVTATKAPAATTTATAAPPDDKATPAPTKKPAVTKATTSAEGTTAETAKKSAPGFPAVFAIAGMLAVAYAMMRRRE